MSNGLAAVVLGCVGTLLVRALIGSFEQMGRTRDALVAFGAGSLFFVVWFWGLWQLCLETRGL